MKLKLVSIAAGFIFILAFSLCNGPEKSPHTASPYLNHADTVSYSGIAACKECHADKYSTFVQTGMGQSFDTAGLLKTSAEFKNQKPVYDAFLDLYYLPFMRLGRMYLKEYRLQGKDTVYARTERIHYIVGSGHHTNSHMLAENGYVFQAPLTFYTQKGQWDLPPGFENGQNTRFSRKIGMECMSCHNALPGYREGSENRYDELPHGISCERCHGPGSLHIREMKKGNTVDIAKETDYTIVHPGKLSWKRQIDICQRCHLQGNAVLKPGKTFASFRPGMVLGETMDQFSPEYHDGEDFVMAAHAERFQKSKCFIAGVSGNLSGEKGRAAFTCISCHNPHVSVRQTNTLQFNTTCKTCHSASKQNLCTEQESRQKATDYNCVSCHMPASGTSDIPHVTVHDHYIRKPTGKSVAKPVQLKGLRCITSDSTDLRTETEAYVSYYEKFDPNGFYLNKALSLSRGLDHRKEAHFATLVHLYYVSDLYREVIRVSQLYKGSTDAWTSYRIAKSFERNGQGSQAEEYFARAVEAAPENLDFILQYAVFQLKAGKLNKAEQLLNRYNGLYSKTAESWAYLGILKLQSGKLAEARQHLLHALSLDPDLLPALENLKIMYDKLGQTAEMAGIQKRIEAIRLRQAKRR